MPLNPNEVTAELGRLNEKLSKLREEIAVLKHEAEKARDNQQTKPLWAAVAVAILVAGSDLALRILGH